MAFFKATCAKNNKKIELLVQFSSLEAAKEYLRKEGYALIEIKETTETNTNSEVFYFEMIIDGKNKVGQINSNDILKAYIKLVEDLNYNITYIYENKDASENEKIIIFKKIRQSYEIYKSRLKEEEIKKPEEKPKDNNLSDSNNINNNLIKELNNYYSLIDKVLEKINFLLDSFNEKISEDKKIKLQDLYTALKQVKNITNISKLKSIGELALIKIGELQIELISQNIMKGKKEILGDTNKLLKGFGSNKQVILPEDDIKLKIDNLGREFLNNFKSSIKGSLKIDKIDTNSGKYFNILRELEIYKIKLREVRKEIYKTFFSFDTEKKERLKLKEKFIRQNINLITSRIKNKKISYTQTIKGLTYYKDTLIFLIQKFGDLVIYSLFLYSIFFLIIDFSNKIFNQNIGINYTFLLNITIISFLGLFLKISKKFSLFVFFSIIYIVLFVYLVVNF